MPKIESLRNYPVASMDGYFVDELTITPESILGNRSFAVVQMSEIQKYYQDSTQIPLRMTQVRFPQLTLFQTVDHDGKLVIAYQGESYFVDQNIQSEESDRPFHISGDQISFSGLLLERAIPLRVSRRSQSVRWAVDCGDQVSAWLSKHLNQEVRLVKAIKHPDSPKHHFTWYTGLHAIVDESARQLAKDTQVTVDYLTFRHNILLSGAAQAYDEEGWKIAVVNGSRVLLEACVRCGYIGIDRTTGILAHHTQVVQNVTREHGMNFGIYIQPEGDGSLTIRVGDLVEVVERR